MQTRGTSKRSDVLVCPVCQAAVAATSSMCLSCHLPIKDVTANQLAGGRRSWQARRRARLLRRRILGLAAYPAAVLWCLTQLPTSMVFVVPGAVAGAWLHVVKGRALLGLAAFLLIVGLMPLLFWPSMLTGLFSELTAPDRR